MKPSLWNWAKLAIGVGLLIFLYSQLDDPAALWQQMIEADKRLLLLGLICYASAVAISGWKWGVLMRAADIHVTAHRLLAYQWVAEFFNNFLPAQVGGDVMRGYAVATDTRRAADAAASVLIDRFIGLAIFMLAAALASLGMLIWGRPDGVPFTPEQQVTVQLIALGSGGITLVLAAMLVALLSRRLKLLVERALIRLPVLRAAAPLWHKIAAAFNVYRHAYDALVWTALGSTLIVLLTSVNIWLIARAIQPGSITLLEVLMINPIIVFVSLIIPLSPGGLGVRQGAFAATFLLVGAGSELGFAAGLLQQFIAYLVSLPGGYLWVRGGSKQPAPPAQPLVSDS